MNVSAREFSGCQQYVLQNLKKANNPDFCLEIDELLIERGEVVGLLGPTGSGKSTLLHLLAGQSPPDSGTLQLRDELCGSALSLEQQRTVTMIDQKPLLVRGSVKQNIELGLRLRGQTKADLVSDLIDRLSLTKIAQQDARSLSGGQTQLVAVARALAIEPEVLLIDEATAHLDPASVSSVEYAVRHYHEQSRCTVVWATHNLFQAQRVASRVALLLEGNLIQCAPTHQFFENPSDARCAAFLQGRMIY